MQRTSTWEDHQARVGRVTGYIARNLDEECSLDDLAALAAFSPCHFHRVFRAVTGEGVAEHRRRLRIERAARALRLTARPIVDIALEAGYDAHESFTRAFESIYGMPPRLFRAERGLLGLRPAAPPLDDLAGSVERIGPLQLIRIRHVGPYDRVGDTFQRLAAWAGPRGLFGPWTRAVGLSHDDPEVVDVSRLRYDAALTVPRPVESEGGVTYFELPARDYVKQVHRGPHSQLSRSYAGLIRHWLRNGNRALADEGSLEFYLNSPETTAPDSLLTEICMPLK